MKLPDGGFRPAYNGQGIAEPVSGIILGVALPYRRRRTRPRDTLSGAAAGGTALRDGVPLAELRSDRPVALILGNEETGVDPAVLALCDTVVTIPGSGRVQSLNAAAAAAVLLYALTAG